MFMSLALIIVPKSLLPSLKFSHADYDKAPTAEGLTVDAFSRFNTILECIIVHIKSQTGIYLTGGHSVILPPGSGNMGAYA